MSRLVLDSTSAKALAATSWPHLIGYFNGKISAWGPGDIARARATGHLLALVDVAGNSPQNASVLDFERGDVQSPAVVAAWVQARNQMRGDATVYVQPTNIAHALSLLRGQKCNLWVVDLSPGGEVPFAVPHYDGMPVNTRVIARQFVLSPHSGGDYDLSIFYADDFHPEQAEPGHLAAARMAASPELGNYAIAGVAAASPAGVATASAAAAAADPSIPPGFGMLGVQVPPDKLAAALSPDAAAADVATPAPIDDQADTALPGAALIASTAPDSPTLAPGPVPLITTDEAADEAADVDPTAAAQAAAAAGPNQRPIDHEFIQHTLNDLHTVANMFHGAGVRNVAYELERVLGMAWDVGGIIKKAGL